METCIYISGGRYNFLETTIAMQNQLQDKPALKQLTLAVKYMCKVRTACLYQRCRAQLLRRFVS